MLGARRITMDGLLALSDQLATAVQRAGQTVVAVNGRPRVPSSGIHWRSGLIVTANHTVHTDEDLTVTSANGRPASATLIGRDSVVDVAVLKVAVSDVAVADIGDSDAVRVGHMVLAVGAGPRASWGVISAIGAPWSHRSETDVFSLDLTLYPGFSGGPLVDARGSIVGLNTSGAARHRQLAIPARVVNHIVDTALRHGRIPHAYLGVGTQQIGVPEGVRGEGEQAQRTALIVVDVQAGSPAAGQLLVGDVILSLDGAPITDPLGLRAMLRPERVGQRITASVIRAGRVLDVALTIGERPGRAR
jgi:S1-C subfamily serine protease